MLILIFYKNIKLPESLDMFLTFQFEALKFSSKDVLNLIPYKIYYFRDF